MSYYWCSRLSPNSAPINSNTKTTLLNHWTINYWGWTSKYLDLDIIVIDVYSGFVINNRWYIVSCSDLLNILYEANNRSFRISIIFCIPRIYSLWVSKKTVLKNIHSSGNFYQVCSSMIYYSIFVFIIIHAKLLRIKWVP